MTPADHYHSQDCNNLLNLNNYHHANNIGTFNTNISSSKSINHNLNNNNSGGGGPNNTNNSSVHIMGGQTPVFFTPSSFIVANHKTSQDLHTIDAMLANKQLNRGAPLQLVDFKEVMGGAAGEGASGTNGGEQIRMAGKRLPHLRFASGGSTEYDPGPGSARSGGDEMSMEYMEGGDYMDQMEGGVGELIKKGSRRLGYDQVKALEKAFELENRLEPERKVRLASQLGLQPRQVAVWFQNRRARWKTKQMERDYTILKNKFEALKADRDKLLQERDHLQAELARFKGHALLEGMPGSKQAKKGEQDSPTLASCSLVDDAAPNQPPAMSIKQAPVPLQGDNDQLEEAEDDEELEEEEASPIKPMTHEQKLLQTDSLSSTEDSDINNDGAIVDSTSKAFQEEPEFYAQHWRLPPAPTQLLYKPNTIKSEEWPEHGENMSSFSMQLETNWYNW